MNKEPRRGISYDNALKNKKINYETFKTLYGFNNETKGGSRAVKVGNDTLMVDNTNYTYQKIVPTVDNAAKGRLF
jgi:hypothetical protein